MVLGSQKPSSFYLNWIKSMFVALWWCQHCFDHSTLLHSSLGYSDLLDPVPNICLWIYRPLWSCSSIKVVSLSSPGIQPHWTTWNSPNLSSSYCCPYMHAFPSTSPFWNSVSPWMSWPLAYQYHGAFPHRSSQKCFVHFLNHSIALFMPPSSLSFSLV